jgi:hypothetical protein
MSRCGRVQLGAYVRYVAGGLLVAAALFKAVVPEADSTGSIRMRPFPRIGYVAMEGAVGVWIIIGRSVVLQHLVSTVAYLVFATIVCFRAISGEGTCGCFGAVRVSPWLMFVVDSTAAVFLIGTFPNRVSETGRSQLGSGALVPPITCGVLLSCVAWINQPGLINSGTTSSFTDGQVVFVEPERWDGGQCPLLAHIDVKEVLSVGSWRLMFYHYGCPKCREILSKFAPGQAGAVEGDRLALIAVPPYGDQDDELFHSAASIHGRLSDRLQWFVETPLEVWVRDGLVEKVGGAGDSVGALLSPRSPPALAP